MSVADSLDGATAGNHNFDISIKKNRVLKVIKTAIVVPSKQHP